MKKTAVTILKFAVSFGILVLIAFKVDTRELWNILKKAHIGYYLAAILVYYIVQVFSAYRWFLLLKPINLKTRFTKILSFYYLGMYFNFFLPTAIGGDAVRVYYLHKEEKRLSQATASGMRSMSRGPPSCRPTRGARRSSPIFPTMSRRDCSSVGSKPSRGRPGGRSRPSSRLY